MLEHASWGFVAVTVVSVAAVAADAVAVAVAGSSDSKRKLVQHFATVIFWVLFPPALTFSSLCLWLGDNPKSSCPSTSLQQL